MLRREKMMIIGKKKIDAIQLAHFTSTSGKYDCFLATHYNGSYQCHDVGAYNKATGEVVRRHYKSRELAMIFYTKFRDEMTTPDMIAEDEDSYTTLKEE